MPSLSSSPGPSFFAFRSKAILCCLTMTLAVFLNNGAYSQEKEKLDIDKTKPNRRILHYCVADGSPIRPLIQDVALRHKYDRQGTPDISADGTKVAYDAWPSELGFAWQESRIIVANIDGSDARDVSDGVMPCFSPDGSMLAVSRPPKYAKVDGAKRMSIWVMKVDGSERQMIADQGAWGARWSSDGQSLVFHGGVDADGKSVPKNCLRLYDFETKAIKNVFTPAESPFEDLSFHFSWSMSGRQVAFTGKRKNTRESVLAVINVDIGIKSLKYLKSNDDTVSVPFRTSIDWHPKGDQLIVTGVTQRLVIPFAVTLDDTTKSIVFAENPTGVGVCDPHYTPDGNNLIAAFIAIPKR